MKLSQITPQLLYKGITKATGYEKWITSKTIIPGFLSTYEIALIYSDPSLTGNKQDPSLIAQFDINRLEIEDKTDQFLKWCDQKGQKPDVSLGFPKEWRNLTWTTKTNNTGHAGVSCYQDSDFIYCGTPLPYKIINHFNNHNEWKKNKLDHLAY